MRLGRPRHLHRWGSHSRLGAGPSGRRLSLRNPGPSSSRQDCRDHQDDPDERDEERAGCGSRDYEEYGESEEAEVQLTVVPVKGFLTVHAGLRRSQKLQRVEEISREGKSSRQTYEGKRSVRAAESMARRAKSKCMAAVREMKPVLSLPPKRCHAFTPDLNRVRGAGD